MSTPLQSQGKPRNVPLPTPSRTSHRFKPYPQNLLLKPSNLRPKCAAKDRLKLWIPTSARGTSTSTSHSSDSNPLGSLSEDDYQRITETMSHAWEESTREAYGAGLLAFHVYCDSKNIPDKDRAPANQTLISGFISNLAASYSGKMIANYVSGVRAWHILHGVKWYLNQAEMDAMLRAAEKLTPASAKRKQRRPYTLDFITAIRHQLKLDDPLDAVVYACLTTCFWASARLGEFTVKRLNGFSPSTHVTRQRLRYDQDRDGNKVTVLHIPKTKAAPAEGEDVFWAKQNGPTDPNEALANHLSINNPPDDAHLFSYCVNKGGRTQRQPMTKTKFLDWVKKAAVAAGLDPLQGHGIRIGSILEYLLRGMPFDVMKTKGRWASDAFTKYLRKHALILAPYIQADAAAHSNFVRYTMPPVR
ncbi:hypothetical protein BJ165DRAFT_1528979 [Panaeolus papilionaceus]|nr:hypothetical protein BJ165DRAFT_1528979 [Panaeolus papilionaceus]